MSVLDSCFRRHRGASPRDVGTTGSRWRQPPLAQRAQRPARRLLHRRRFLVLWPLWRPGDHPAVGLPALPSWPSFAHRMSSPAGAAHRRVTPTTKISCAGCSRTTALPRSWATSLTAARPRRERAAATRHRRARLSMPRARRGRPPCFPPVRATGGHRVQQQAPDVRRCQQLHHHGRAEDRPSPARLVTCSPPPTALTHHCPSEDRVA
jgi:hypothetical protein